MWARVVQELENSPTDLARLVRQTEYTGAKRIAVSAAAVRGWTARDPRAWHKVQEWLAAKGVRILTVDPTGRTPGDASLAE